MSETARPNRWLARSMTAACIALLVTASLACTGAHADPREAAPAWSVAAVDRFTSADLESAFWDCDYAATTFGAGLREGAYCAEIYEEVKNRKFSGDFHAMLAWWQQNKPAKQAALAARWRVAP